MTVSISQLSNHAQKAYESGHWQLAEVLYRQLLEQQPHHVAAWHQLAKTYQFQGKLAEAIATCHKSIQLKPELAQSYKLLGSLLKSRGSLEAASRAYTQAENALPNLITPQDRLSLGNAFARQQKFDRAIDFYQESLQGQQTILFFSPDVGVIPHFATQCVIGCTLKELGHRVIFMPCGEILDPFTIQDISQLSQVLQPQWIARQAVRYTEIADRALDSYGLESLDLKAFLAADDRERVREAIQNRPGDLRAFEFDGVAFGKLAVGDLVLATKRCQFEQVSPEVYSLWLTYIEYGLLSYLAIKKICSTLSVSCFVHFNDYLPMLATRMAARKFGIRTLGVSQASHKNVDRRRYVFLSNVWKKMYYKQLKLWKELRLLALPSSIIKEITEDLFVRFKGKGSHIYSLGKAPQQQDLHSLLRLSQEKKTLVAYTSSLDEAIAAQIVLEGMEIPIQKFSQPFKNQIDWLESLTQYVEKSSTLQLVVRVHPREGKTKRDGTASEHLVQLKENFDRPFDNCRFVWPEDPISSYDLAEIATLALISWSTIGLELARCGVPVLAATKGVAAFPEDDFIQWGQTPELYFQKLEILLQETTTLDRVIHAFRWYNLYHLGTSLNLEDVVPASDFTGFPPFRLPNEATAIEEVVTRGKDILELNWERLKRSQFSRRTVEEKQSLKQQLRRLLHFIFTGEDTAGDAPLILLQSLEELSLGDGSQFRDLPQSRYISIRGSLVDYIFNQKTYCRYSPMCARIAMICAEP